MKILIITTYFPPDTAIAAVRPYMFARHLTAAGNEVTVLRSGLIDKISSSSDIDNNGFEIITVTEGHSSFTTVPNPAESDKKHLAFLPQVLRAPLKITYNALKAQHTDMERITAAKELFNRQKEIIDRMGGSFDIIFSTFGDLENVIAGEYAAKKFGAKWILDLRDPIVAYHLGFRLIWNTYAEKVQTQALKKADMVTTVSHSLSAQMRSNVPDANIFTLTNGYDPSERSGVCDAAPDRDVFRICYTGQFYQQRIDALNCLVLIIKQLIAKGRIDRNKFRFAYAGAESKTFLAAFERHGLSDITEDYGYLDKDAVQELQLRSDIFLVLSWNTDRSRGVITGKFYEGIKTERAILTVVAGERPYSELFKLNKKYDYGFCMECCRKETAKGCYKWLANCYNDKMSNGYNSYKTPHALKQAFRYDVLSSELQKLMRSLIKDDEAKNK